MNNKKPMNRLVSILLCCVWLLSPVTLVLVSGNMTAQAVSPLWNGSVAAGFAGGTGTEADPYLISTAEQLAYFSQRVNGGTSYAGQYIQLTQDILLNEMNGDGSFVSATPRQFTSIGSGLNKSFQGHFDGYGKKVIGLYINKSWPDYWGLFGYAGGGSVIRNVSISGSVKGRNYTGGVAGYTNGVITGCTISATVTGRENYAGGVAGYAAVNSEISNCTVSGTVSGRYYVGGVAGRTDGKITECTINCTVTGGENYAGGVAGYAAGANNEISNCTVSGSVQGRYYVGGVAGRIEGTITGCSVSGTVKGLENYVGGVAGYAADQSEVSDSSAAGTVTGRYYVGGVVGRTDETVTGCSSDSTVTGLENYIGGVAGYADTDSVVSDSSAAGTVTGRYFIGGVAGYTDGVITVCANNGAVTGIENYIGGVVGYADSNNTVSNCFNSGAIAGRNGVGGIAGAGNWTGDGSTINNNLSVGSVTGSNNVGGIVGSSQEPLDPEDAWNNYYINAPSGTGSGDVSEQDGAVPINGMSWEEIVALLNGNNPAGNDVWSEDENGIPVPGIFVPNNAVEILNASIKEGRYYTAAPVGAGTAAAITSDSVFTVVFCMGYNETYHLETQTLGLANEGTVIPLPANTSIIMLVDGGYYYKNLTTELATKLALSEFIKMGSTTEHYAPAEPVPAEATKEYLFIFDFSKTTSGVAAGAYKVELLPAAGTPAGTMPSVTVAGNNTYSLTASGATGSLTVNLSSTPVAGYDYKTDGKGYAYELHLEQGGVTVPFPIGTKINGIFISSLLPYAFTASAFGDRPVSIDMSGCAIPLAPGSYNVQIKAYACTDTTTPRDGYLLANGVTAITLATPAQYAIKATAATRVFNNSAATIPVVFNIETLGSGTVKATLQRKYGMVYVNITDQTNLPVSISGGSATLTIPAGYANGTYRFVLTLYDNNDTARAQAVESVIIK